MTAPPLPAQLGRYRPVALLGTGGMGSVYKAHDPLIDRMVAVKVVDNSALTGASRAEYLERFRQEVQAAGRCTHPAIVAVHDFSGESGDPFIVMELVEGRSLKQMLAEPAMRGGLPAVPILLQVLGGLAYAHRLGVTHRDIKPANILITAAGDAKIADFGIARLGATAAAGESVLTQVGSVLGTPGYMAPEQVTGEAVDPRADLFAVGAILYQALTGRTPFAGRSMSETLQRLIGPEPASMVAVEAADRGGFVPVLQRALAKPRAQRFQTAEAFAAALQEASARPCAPMPADDGMADTRVLEPPGPAPGSGGGQWDPAMLQRVERALARYVGPMARVLVHQAARQSDSSDALYQALARRLESSADRSAFLRALGGPRVEPTLGPRRRPEPAVAPATAAVSAEAMMAAQTALAFHVGPIARMLVRQAASQAASRQDFIELLCAHVTKPDELTALRRRLRADVEPKLR